MSSESVTDMLGKKKKKTKKQKREREKKKKKTGGVWVCVGVGWGAGAPPNLSVNKFSLHFPWHIIVLFLSGIRIPPSELKPFCRRSLRRTCSAKSRESPPSISVNKFSLQHCHKQTIVLFHSGICVPPSKPEEPFAGVGVCD